MLKGVLLLGRNGFSKRMANFASLPKHPSTADQWAKGSGVLPRGVPLKVGSWNVNGIRAIQKKGNLSEYLREQQPDFLCINETKIDYEGYQKIMNPPAKRKSKKVVQEAEGEGVLDERLVWEGYEGYWNFCKVSAGYSGVLTLSKHRPLSVEEDLPLHLKHSLEGRVMTL